MNQMTNILIIEDEEAIRENILELLEAENFKAIGAENGIKGIEIAKQNKLDLIICDVMMPEIDGYGVLKALRQEPDTATVPFIFLTALADKTDTRKGMELGADDYLTKPCTPEELLKAIAIRLKKQAAINQQQTQKLQELRQNITYSLPHELRTPLNGIMGFTDLLLAELKPLDNPEGELNLLVASQSQLTSLTISEFREILEHIQTSSQRLYRLIQNFLLYAELELVANTPERIKALRSHWIDGVKSSIMEQVISQAKQAERETDLYLDLQDASVQISSKYLKKLMEELLDNAFKFSSPGTPVYLSSKVENNSFVLSLTDKGRGMTEEQITNLGAYMQFERKLYEQQGSGLGLTIAKRLAELHGGELTIESLPNTQTTVRVVLPKAIPILLN